MNKQYLIATIGIIALSLGIVYAIPLEANILKSTNGVLLESLYPIFISAIIGFPTLLYVLWTKTRVESHIPE